MSYSTHLHGIHLSRLNGQTSSGIIIIHGVKVVVVHLFISSLIVSILLHLKICVILLKVVIQPVIKILVNLIPIRCSIIIVPKCLSLTERTGNLAGFARHARLEGGTEGYLGTKVVPIDIIPLSVISRLRLAIIIRC